MALSVTSENIPVSWKQTLTGKPVKSTHFALAGMFNLMCLLELVKTFSRLVAARKAAPELIFLLAFALFFLTMAAWSMWHVYQRSRVQLQLLDNSTVLFISYLALRLYICVLGVAMMLLVTINLSPT